MRLAILESKAPEGSFAVVPCADDKSGQVTIREQEVDVTYEIWRFEMNGSVFAYKLVGGWASGSGNQRVHFGTATSLLFYDPDGCGRFKVMRDADGDGPFTRNLHTVVSSGTGSRPRSIPTNCRITGESYSASSTAGSDRLNHCWVASNRSRIPWGDTVQASKWEDVQFLPCFADACPRQLGVNCHAG